MNKKKLLCALLLSSSGLFAQNAYDLVIVGGNPGGIMAAISAARMGKTSVILERTRYIGGLPANGLGATDIATRAATTGLFREFVDRIKQYYMDTPSGPERVGDGNNDFDSLGIRLGIGGQYNITDHIALRAMARYIHMTDDEYIKSMTELSLGLRYMF